MTRVARIKLTCLKCGTAFETPPCYIRKGGGKYCSRQCYAYHAQRFGGHARKNLTMRHKGYVLCWRPNHMHNVKGYVPEHRLVMEEIMGRPLHAEEIVHHINHKRDDNRPENLQLTCHSEHMFIHNAIKVILHGEVLSFGDACKILGVDRSTARSMKNRHGWNHQQTIEHYKKNGKRRYKDDLLWD